MQPPLPLIFIYYRRRKKVKVPTFHGVLDHVNELVTNVTKIIVPCSCQLNLLLLRFNYRTQNYHYPFLSLNNKHVYYQFARPHKVLSLNFNHVCLSTSLSVLLPC